MHGDLRPDLAQAAECGLHRGVHSRVHTHHDLRHLGAPQHVADLTDVASYEQAGAATAQVMREIGEHLRGRHVDRRGGLGVEDDGAGIRRLRDPADPGAHVVGVREEQACLHAHDLDTRRLLGRRVAGEVDPGGIGAAVRPSTATFGRDAR